MTDSRVRLSVIGEFLRGGKTALLNRLLTQSQGQRLAMLVKDFGAMNIDAPLVASQDGSIVALTNGCGCCQIGGDVTATLIAKSLPGKNAKQQTTS